MSRLVAVSPEVQERVMRRVEEHLGAGGLLLDLPRYAVHAVAGACPDRHVRALRMWLDGPMTAAVAVEERVDAALIVSRLNGVRRHLATTLGAQAALAERRAIEHANRKARAKLQSGTRDRFAGFPDARALNAAGGMATVLDGAWTAVKASMEEAIVEAAADKTAILAPVVGPAEADTQADLYRRRGLEAVAFLMSLLAARAEGAITGDRRVPLLGPGIRRAAQYTEGASGALDQDPARGVTRVPPDVMAVIAALPEQRLTWTWTHDFYGVPNQPFDPHVEIDGNVYSTAELEDLEWFPGDHQGCLCENIPELTVG